VATHRFSRKTTLTGGQAHTLVPRTIVGFGLGRKSVGLLTGYRSLTTSEPYADGRIGSCWID